MEYIIDATHQSLGRIASHIALLLQGKQRPAYHPAVLGNDRVIVRNAAHMLMHSRKAEQKIYYRHTGYMGHLRRRTLKAAFAQSPEEVVRRAVLHMLPKNKLRNRRIERLVIER